MWPIFAPMVGKRKRGPRAGRPKRRTFAPEYSLAIVEEYERQTEPGAKGALLRREGLYHSHLNEWTRARDAGALDGQDGRADRAEAQEHGGEGE